MTVEFAHLCPTFLMPRLSGQGSSLGLVCFSLYVMCTALHSELQTRDSAELDWESGKQQQAAAPNRRSQSHFANQGEYWGHKKPKALFRVPLKRRRYKARIWLLYLLSLGTSCPDTPCLQQVQRPLPQCKSQKELGSGLNPPTQNRACYLNFLTFHCLRGGDNTPFTDLA